MGSRDVAVTEVVAEILILALVLALGGIVFVMVFGVIPQIPETSYLAVESSMVERPGYSLISFHHQAGDTLNLTGLEGAVHPAAIYVDTPGGSFLAVPAAGAPTFQPGDTLYLYNTGSGYTVTRDSSGTGAVPFAVGTLRVRFVDTATDLLIQSWDYSTPVPSPTSMAAVTTTSVPTISMTTGTETTTITTTDATPSPTTTITAEPTTTTTLTPTDTATSTTTVTPTPTVTTAVTTTTTTATPTATPATLAVTVSWSPGGAGIGCGSVSPPTCLGANPASVSVVTGSSQTFSFIPAVANKAVTSITLDGVVVYSGSSKGVTVSYSLTNIVSAHTLAATFG